MAGSLPVQRRAGPECLQAEQVEGGGHVHVVEAGFGQSAVACASRAVAGGLVHGAFDVGAAGVVGPERDRGFRGAGGGLGFGQAAGQDGELPSFLAAGSALGADRAGAAVAGGKVATAAAWPLWAHGVQDAEVLPCGQVTVLVS